MAPWKKYGSAVFAAGLLMIAALMPAQSQTTGVLREVYSNIGGGTVADLQASPNYPNNPDAMFVESSFEAPSNFADNYGQRMRALLVPPVTGTYVFWIASDDGSALYLSTDENPVHKTQIASEAAWTNARQWTKDPSQKSAAITLTKGTRYYIEALQKEGGGGDNLAVAWQKPGDAAPLDGDPPIPGTYLIPYGLGPPVITAQPTNVTLIEGGVAGFAFQLSQSLGCSYQWRRGGVAIPGATNSTYQTGFLAVSDSGSTFNCLISNAYGITNTSSASVTVNRDVTRPTLSAVGNLGDPRILTVIFSEAVDPGTALVAGNYAINNGVNVLSATFGPDTRTIILTTTAMAQQVPYTLTVNNVQDRASIPNPILANSQFAFTLSTSPLDISFVRPAPEPIGPASRHGPVVISEIMYHPTNRVDGKNLEYIELFNSQPFIEDISGFRLAGQVSFTFPSNTVMSPKTYLVVASVPADLTSVYGTGNVMGPYTNKLSNTAGTLSLLNRQGGVLFTINYSSDPPWPASPDGAGHSLVLARPSLGAGNPDAWAASDLMGGTPGRAELVNANPYRTVVINEFLAHTDLPDVDYIELFNYGSAAVDLSGCFLTDSPDTNRFVMPSGTIIPAMGFVLFTESQLGYRLNATGETIYLKNPGNTKVIDSVRFVAQENGVSTGRCPDGAAGFYRLQTKSPGTNNSPARVSPVVINEIMYDPLSGNADDQYVELYNRSAVPVDVSRWSFTDGIKYTIPNGTVIPANNYLVIARNAVRMLTNYPGLSGANTVGDFSGSLSHGGDHLALALPTNHATVNSSGQPITNIIHVVVDEVTYGTGGRWGKWAHGGGSSLELMDPRSDHRLAPNWADSDESSRSGWTNIEYTGVLENGDVAADSLQIFLLGGGECLVDNVEVFVSGGGANLISNPDFETGLTGWVATGNHEDSSLETGQGYNNSAHCLHIRATDHGDTGANRIRTTLTTGLSAGQTVTLRAKVRWLAGFPEILLRLHGNWLEATGNTLTARNLGTPGQPNSRARTNVGPAITAVTHSPILPAFNQAITVVARVNDPDGLGSLVLKYRIDPSTNLVLVPMVNNGAGLYSAVIPGQGSGAMIAFHVQGSDGFSPSASTTFPNDAPVRECLVRVADTAQSGNFGTYRLWMSQATLNRWSSREHLSNKPLDCTFVYGNYRVIYNMGGEYSGSPYHSPGFNSPIGNVCDYLLTFPDDDTLLGEGDATLQWPGNGGGDNTYQREQTAYWIANQIGLPYCNRRSVNMFVNGVRRAEMMEDVQQPNGDMAGEYFPNANGGDLHKVQVWFEFENDAATFTPVGASLQNVLNSKGQKSLPTYRWTFAKRAVQDSASNYTNLFALVDTVNYNGLGTPYRQKLEATIDVDNWLRTYAVEHVVGNNDSFAFGSGQNMYAFKPSADLWRLMIWDIDFAFVSLGPTGDDLFAGIGRSNGIDLSEPNYLRRYWEILQDLANGPLVASKANTLIDSRYNAMVANGRTVDSPTTTIESYLSQRRTYILNLIAANANPAFAITLNNGAAFSTNRNVISLTGNAPLNVRSFTLNGVNLPITWTSTNKWVATVTLAGGLNALTVQGRDAAGLAVSGASATINVTYTGLVEQPQDRLVINEIMYHPAATNASYVEIYNTSGVNSFDLSGWLLKGAAFTFPAGTIIGPGSFLVVASDAAGFATAYGANIPLVGVFSGKLSNTSENLRLVKPGATSSQDLVVDEVLYDSLPPWPSGADGAGASLQLLDPTQDNNRVANWVAVGTNSTAPQAQWHYVTTTGTASSSTLYIYLGSSGDVYLDDIKLVAGSVPEVGANLLANGDFESAFPGPYGISPNLTQSAVSTTIKHTGTRSLHVVDSTGGTTRASSIYQDMTPGLTVGATYTLSYWYLDSTNGGPLTLRLSGSGIVSTVNYAPPGQPPALARYTPGASNSVLAAIPAIPKIWLNEILPANASGATDRLGHHHPWAELYNGGTTNLSLAGYFLANNYSNLTQWPFPAGTTLNAGQFLTVWLDGNPGESIASELHTSFVVPTNTGSLALVSINGGRTNLIDYLNYNVPQADHSYGSSPEGTITGRGVFYYPTFATTNNPASAPLAVFINEWMADNSGTLADPADNNFDDWFEIYNPGNTTADLAGYYLGTSLTNKTKFLVPSGYVVPAHGYLLVWADNQSAQNSTNLPDLHTNFKLSKSGEAIGIFAADGTVIDFVAFGAQVTDVSQGRFPDGAANIITLSVPTPRAVNLFQLPNTPPILDPVAAQTVTEGQLLLISLHAIDTNVPAQNLVFSLDPGAPTNAAINSATGLLSWRPTPDQAPSTASFTARVTDDGTPPLTATTTFAVGVVKRPQINSVTPDTHGNFIVSFGTLAGKSYRLEFKNSLLDSTWLPAAPDLTASGSSSTISDELTNGAARRFYRVVILN